MGFEGVFIAVDEDSMDEDGTEAEEEGDGAVLPGEPPFWVSTGALVAPSGAEVAADAELEGAIVFDEAALEV